MGNARRGLAKNMFGEPNVDVFVLMAHSGHLAFGVEITDWFETSALGRAKRTLPYPICVPSLIPFVSIDLRFTVFLQHWCANRCVNTRDYI